MNKIASSLELQSELQRILRLASEPNPSRVRLANELYALGDRLAAGLQAKWTEKGDSWVTRAQYADGAKHEWTIKEEDGKFSLSVKTPKGSYEKKKPADSLQQAQKAAEKFITKANGQEMLDDALGKDFSKK